MTHKRTGGKPRVPTWIDFELDPVHVTEIHPDNHCLRPDVYPTECQTDAGGLRTLRRWLLDEDHNFGWSVPPKWPPRDEGGFVYPIVFDPEDVNDDGRLTDRNDNDYRPFAGNVVPTKYEQNCHSPLQSWKIRYGHQRYCAKRTPNDFCHSHQNRKGTLMKTAEEHMQTGLFNKTVDKYYVRIGPWKRLTGWGGFESLMGESTYEFAPEYHEKTFDFSECDVVPDACNDEDKLTVKCGYPTQHTDPALSLFVASMMGVQMLNVQPMIMYEDEAAGEGMMESRSIEYASLTAPTDADPTQNFETLEAWTEHHLNLPFSRLVRDRPKLLERGGVIVDPTSEESDEVSGDDIVLEIEASPENIETTDDDRGAVDPGQFDGGIPESERIVQSTQDGHVPGVETSDTESDTVATDDT